MPEGSLLVARSSIGLWVGLVHEPKVFTLRWARLGWVSRLVGWVGLSKLDPRTTLVVPIRGLPLVRGGAGRRA